MMYAKNGSNKEISTWCITVEKKKRWQQYLFCICEIGKTNEKKSHLISNRIFFRNDRKASKGNMNTNVARNSNSLFFKSIK